MSPSVTRWENIGSYSAAQEKVALQMANRGWGKTVRDMTGPFVDRNSTILSLANMLEPMDLTGDGSYLAGVRDGFIL
ncbi:hypothetical protein KIPB_013238, partial [Kipferlia bialata]|eukprot:g13238.t1